MMTQRSTDSSTVIAELGKLLREARAENTALGVRIQQEWAKTERLEAERDDLRARLTEAAVVMRDVATWAMANRLDHQIIRGLRAAADHAAPLELPSVTEFREAADRAAPSEEPTP